VKQKVLDENFDTKSTPAISPFLWGGSMYEPETDLYWMRNRYYHKADSVINLRMDCFVP